MLMQSKTESASILGNSADFDEICIPGVELSKFRVGHYADAKIDDIGDVSLPNNESFLDIDAFGAMRELIEADILIISKSSFCLYASLISDGIKICEPGQQLMDDWILRSEDGSFDRSLFNVDCPCLSSLRLHAPDKRGGFNGSLEHWPPDEIRTLLT